MNYLQEIVKQINAELLTAMSCDQAKFYGLTDLIAQGDKTFPIEINGQEGCKIVFDDRMPLQIYHRLISQSKVADPANGRGDNIYQVFTNSMRLFCIGTKDSFVPTCEDSNLQWLSKVDTGISRQPNISITGITRIRTRITGSNSNTESIVTSEFPGYDLKKLNPLKIIAFSIDYEITGRICENECGEASSTLCADVTVIDTDLTEHEIPAGGEYTCTIPPLIPCDPVDVTDTDGSHHEVASGGSYECTIPPVDPLTRIEDITFYDGDVNEAWIQSIGYDGTYSYEFLSNIASYSVYVNGVLQVGAWSFIQGDSLRIVIIKETEPGNANIQLTFTLTNSQIISRQSDPFYIARWNVQTVGSTTSDEFKYGYPETIVQDQPTDFSWSLYWAVSHQSVNVDDGEFSIEWRFTDIGIFYPGLMLGFSDNPMAGAADKYIRMDAACYISNGQSYDAYSDGAGVGACNVSAVQIAAGGGLFWTGIATKARQRIRCVPAGGTNYTITWEVMPGGDAYGTWVVMRTIVKSFANGTLIYAMYNADNKGIYFEGMKLYGSWS